MTLSEPHPTNPYEEVAVELGDYQFARALRRAPRAHGARMAAFS